MIPLPLVIAYVFAVLAVCGVGYLLLTMFAALRWVGGNARRTDTTAFAPGVSILKPLRGSDRDMYAALRSHCLQQYAGEYELLFGVATADDPAVADVQRLQQEFPQRNIRLIICEQRLGPNGKVSVLAQLEKHARYTFILVNDSDIRVEEDYLATVTAPFASAKVGMVTALYRAHATSLAARVEALGISTDFAGGVLSALVVDGKLSFALGSTLAIRREVLTAIGGFEALVDYLADDYELGARTVRAGYTVELAPTVVETVLPHYGWGGMLDHQLRWARTIRDMRKGGYIGLLFTFALPWAALAAVFARNSWSMALLAVTLLARLMAAFVLCGPVLADTERIRDFWLLPLRDFFGLFVWIASFAGNTVTWRGEKFVVRDGKLERSA